MLTGTEVVVAAVLAVIWMHFDLSDVEFRRGDVAYLCEASLRDPGPKDSIYTAYCEYEPLMEWWIGSGSGPMLGVRFTMPWREPRRRAYFLNADSDDGKVL